MDTVNFATLTRWHDFYLITGAAAATLTGLQFVTQSVLATGARRSLGSADPAGGIDAFGSPTVVHLTIALVLSALMCVPWGGSGSLSGTLGVLGVGALAYSAVVLRRTRRQRSYVPVAEDWAWHVVLPAVAYAAVLLAAVLPGRALAGALLTVAAATLLLLCIGIHNAWDTFTYLTMNALRSAHPGEPAPPPSVPDSIQG